MKWLNENIFNQSRKLDVKRMAVDVVIVSHNNKNILGDCIDSIKSQSYRGYKIYLLDNDSMDGTKQFISEKYPEVDFFELNRIGPSEKRNKGISMTHSEYIVFMDSDAMIANDWLEKAIKFMEVNRSIGICGGKIYGIDGKIDDAGGIITNYFIARGRGQTKKDSGQYDYYEYVPFVKSAAVMIRREMLNQTGGFDSDYFYWYEDTDLGIRANLYGWKVIYNPDLVSWHLSHHTIKKEDYKMMRFIGSRNRITTLLKNFETNTILINSPSLLLSLIYQMLFKKDGSAVFNAVVWNIWNIKSTNKKRKDIQKGRKITDKRLSDKMPLFLQSSINNKHVNFLLGIKSKRLESITFFVTDRCNSRCKHCFNWKNLNKKKDMTLEEVEKIFIQFGRLKSVLLSGGEPFIREDFVDLIGVIVKCNNPNVISIPTNCLLEKKILHDLEEILNKHQRTDFIVTCSLDGFEEYNDYARGVKGSFKDTVSTIRKLKILQSKYKNFRNVNVNTVITHENKDDLKGLVDFVKTLNVDIHSFDIIRGDHKGIMTMPSLKEFKIINRLRYDTGKYYSSKMFKNPIRKFYENLKSKHIIDTQMRVLSGKKWDLNCNAGINNLVVDSDGSLRICELTNRLGDLKESNYEYLLKTDDAKRIFNMEANHQCDCTHICNIYMSMNHSLKVA